jgi:hypothetical protein
MHSDASVDTRAFVANENAVGQASPGRGRSTAFEAYLIVRIKLQLFKRMLYGVGIHRNTKLKSKVDDDFLED